LDILFAMKNSAFILIVYLIFISSCARSFNPDIERGSDYHFRDGYPEVRFSAVGLIDETGQPKINLNADIVYGSLIYKQNDDKYFASITIDVQIIDEADGTNMTRSKQYQVDITKDYRNIAFSQETFAVNKEINVAPGDYKVNFTVIDQSSDKQITSTARTFIPNPKNNVTNLTNILLMGKKVQGENPAVWSPITTYDVPGRVDSLKFIFQVTNNDSEEPLVVNSRLMRFKADTAAARPMYYSNYSPSTIGYKGIDYDQETEIQATQRVLQQPRNVLIEFTFGKQERGNYRFEVTTNKSQADSEDPLYKARDFGIKSENYPAVKSAEEFARPLVYLMGKKEYKQLMEIQNPDSMKAAIDRFWLKNIGRISLARSVIQKYYQRVEEANKQFSNFKEGWKTGPGMIYVLFGPPWYMNQHYNKMEWAYTFDERDNRYNFFFKKSKFKSKFYPFSHYLLQRSEGYFTVFNQQRSLWLNGIIMTKDV